MASITLNNFEIINDGQQLSIEVETVSGSTITSILLWNIDTFKNYDLSYDLSYKLEQTSNIESFIVNAGELSITSFTDIYFIEIETDYEGEEDCTTCNCSALGITYNFQPYYKCMLNYLFKSEKNNNPFNIDVYSNNLTITVKLLIDSIEKSLEIGYYIQAIEMLRNLKKLCSVSSCTNCETITCSSCSNFIQN